MDLRPCVKIYKIIQISKKSAGGHGPPVPPRSYGPDRHKPVVNIELALRVQCSCGELQFAVCVVVGCATAHTHKHDRFTEEESRPVMTAWELRS